MTPVAAPRVSYLIHHVDLAILLYRRSAYVKSSLVYARAPVEGSPQPREDRRSFEISVVRLFVDRSEEAVQIIRAIATVTPSEPPSPWTWRRITATS